MAEYRTVRFQNESSESQDVDTLCPPPPHSRVSHYRRAKKLHRGDGTARQPPRRGTGLAGHGMEYGTAESAVAWASHAIDAACERTADARCSKSQKKSSWLTASCRAGIQSPAT